MAGWNVAEYKWDFGRVKCQNLDCQREYCGPTLLVRWKRARLWRAYCQMCAVDIVPQAKREESRR